MDFTHRESAVCDCCTALSPSMVHSTDWVRMSRCILCVYVCMRVCMSSHLLSKCEDNLLSCSKMHRRYSRRTTGAVDVLQSCQDKVAHSNPWWTVCIGCAGYVTAAQHFHMPFSEGTCQKNIPFSNFLICHRTEKLCTNIWGSSKL